MNRNYSKILLQKTPFVLICTKALPLIDRTRFTVLTVNLSHNIISPYSLSKCVNMSNVHFFIILIMQYKTICLFPLHPQRAFGFVHILI